MYRLKVYRLGKEVNIILVNQFSFTILNSSLERCVLCKIADPRNVCIYVCMPKHEYCGRRGREYQRPYILFCSVKCFFMYLFKLKVAIYLVVYRLNHLRTIRKYTATLKKIHSSIKLLETGAKIQ